MLRGFPLWLQMCTNLGKNAHDDTVEYRGYNCLVKQCILMQITTFTPLKIDIVLPPSPDLQVFPMYCPVMHNMSISCPSQGHALLNDPV